MSNREKNWILIYDIDGANPYGRELAALLNTVMAVKALVPTNTEWTPATISTYRILPSNGPSFIWVQIFRQLRGLVAVAMAAFIGRATIVIVLDSKLVRRVVACNCGNVGCAHSCHRT